MTYVSATGSSNHPLIDRFKQEPAPLPASAFGKAVTPASLTVVKPPSYVIINNAGTYIPENFSKINYLERNILNLTISNYLLILLTLFYI